LINLDFADVRAVMRGMGRAMMGTGEASGDKRAMQAAEAAIANPLLDETSMQGAKGLLISITGGNDLTLYEVDAAATRIRDEVDPDANIILGATFDEALEGVIRVSVVATGIKPEESQIDVAGRQPAAMAIAEKQTPAAEAPKPMEEKRPEPIATRPVPAPEAAPKPAPRDFAELSRDLRAAIAQPATAEIPAEPAPAPAAPVEHAGVTLERRAPQAATPAMPQPRPEPAPVAEEPAIEADEAFIPEAAERPVSTPRMPSIEDFPAPGQAEYRAHQAEQRGEPAAQHRRPGLFERITSGLTRREDDGLDGMDDMAHGQAEAPRAAAPAPASEYAKRPRPVQHESQVTHAPRRMVAGSAAPQAHVEADDEYEIPAFLRRQSN
ncbi:MAG: cell division protein FtsZ, partial [Rhodobiaceae bacterium]|nr:cell division protein FtsZ [Rhodobiaceae bacterium]